MVAEGLLEQPIEAAIALSAAFDLILSNAWCDQQSLFRSVGYL